MTLHVTVLQAPACSALRPSGVHITQILYRRIHYATIHTLPGFLLGTRQTLLETFDGGKTWASRSVEAAQVGTNTLMYCARMHKST